MELYLYGFGYDMETKKQIGQEGENLILEYYENDGYEILDTNYTIPGGEIDIVAQKDGEIAFVEVKVVDATDDLMGYISKKKMQALERSLQDYMYKKNLDFSVRLDVAFVKNDKILEIYENITNM